MLFASKIIKDRPLQISAQGGQMKLMITNISLDPESSNALLYLCASEEKEQEILIVSLKKAGLETYRSNFELLIEKPIKFIAKGGTVHVIGNYQQIQTSMYKDKSNHQIYIKKLTLPSIKQKLEKKYEKSEQNNPKEGLKRIAVKGQYLQLDDNEDDDDDDESYSAQGDQSSSDSIQEEEKQDLKTRQKQNKKQKLSKKKQTKNVTNWASLLTKKDDDDDSDRQDEDDDYSEESQQESSQSLQNQQDQQEAELHNEEKKLEKNEKMKIKVEKKIKINDKFNKRCKNPQQKKQAKKINEPNNESDSFQYKVPNDLPDFVAKNATTTIIL